MSREKLVRAGVSLITSVTLAACQVGLVSAPVTEKKPQEPTPNSASVPPENTPTETNPMINNQVKVTPQPKNASYVGGMEVPDYSVTATPKVKPTQEITPTKEPTVEPTVGALQAKANFPYVGHENLNNFSNDEQLRTQVSTIEKICLNWATADKPPIDCSGLFQINDDTSPRSTDIFNIGGRLVIGYKDENGDQRYTLPKGALSDRNYTPESGYASGHKLTDNDSPISFGNNLSKKTSTELGIADEATVTFNKNGTALIAQVNGKTVAQVSSETGQWEKVVEFHAGIPATMAECNQTPTTPEQWEQYNAVLKTELANRTIENKISIGQVENSFGESLPYSYFNVSIKLEHILGCSVEKDTDGKATSLTLSFTDGEGRILHAQITNLEASAEFTPTRYLKEYANEYEPLFNPDTIIENLNNGNYKGVIVSMFVGEMFNSATEEMKKEWEEVTEILNQQLEEPFVMTSTKGSSVTVNELSHIIWCFLHQSLYSEETVAEAYEILTGSGKVLPSPMFKGVPKNQ